ncbi:MAG: ArsR/SmtB family transcription factor [Candidatus Humimicrobiaceae bacterium]
MNNIFVLHANICKTLANPKRLEIIEVLRDDELNATQLTRKVFISKANLSQHMSILIQKGVVLSRREGLNVFYKLSDTRITKACDLMRDVLIKNLEQNNNILKDIKIQANTNYDETKAYISGL